MWGNIERVKVTEKGLYEGTYYKAIWNMGSRRDGSEYGCANCGEVPEI